jgi:DNA gyrase/topoisomerase IV subunit A
MIDNLVKEENDCLKKENKIIRDSIRRLTNFVNGHKNDREVQEIGKDLQGLLEILEQQRNLISSFEGGLERSQSQYEQILERSLQEARVSSNKPGASNYLAEQVVREEKNVERLEQEYKTKLSQTAKEIIDCKTAQIYQNAELLNTPIIPSKSPTMHKSGARLNESKKTKYLSPLN